MSAKILRLPEVLEKTGLKRSTVYLKMNAGEFPKQISLGSRSVGWVSDAIDNWIVDRIKASHQGSWAMKNYDPVQNELVDFLSHVVVELSEYTDRPGAECSASHPDLEVLKIHIARVVEDIQLCPEPQNQSIKRSKGGDKTVTKLT